jgi:signal transduction histidine kinase
MVRNLLSNALRHATSSVAITLSQDDDSIRLTITDDGPGVPTPMQDRIFERFGRADDARTRDDGGTGLGLAIARDIAQRHQGQIRYDNSWTGGARFIIDLDTAEP